jgi:hypothetical protein
MVSFVIAVSTAQAADKSPAFAGWYNLLPPCQKHIWPHFDKPVIEKNKGGETTYSQTAHFDFMTNLPRSFRVTVTRDPAFKDQFGAETLKKAPATILDMDKRKAWVWEDKKRVVVPLGEDKAVVLETDPHSEPMPLVEYAKSLDYDRIEQALAQPPRADFTVTLETFKAFKKGDPILGLYDWAGPAKSHEPIGKKEDERVLWTYLLKDDSKVLLTTAGAKIESVIYESADGTRLELLK